VGLLLLLACQVGGCLGVARFQAMGVMQKDCTVGMQHAAVVMQVSKSWLLLILVSAYMQQKTAWG
jgi:hypothetical protein